MKYSLSILFISLIVFSILHASRAYPTPRKKAHTPAPKTALVVPDSPEHLVNVAPPSLLSAQVASIPAPSLMKVKITSMSAFLASAQIQVLKTVPFKDKAPVFTLNQDVLDEYLDEYNYLFNDVIADIGLLTKLTFDKIPEQTTPNTFNEVVQNFTTVAEKILIKINTVFNLGSEYKKSATDTDEDALVEARMAWLEMLKTVCYIKGTMIPVRFIYRYQLFAESIPKYKKHVMGVSDKMTNDFNLLYFKAWTAGAQLTDNCLNLGVKKSGIRILNHSTQYEMDLLLISDKIGIIISWFSTNKPNSKSTVILDNTTEYGKNIQNYSNHWITLITELSAFFAEYGV